MQFRGFNETSIMSANIYHAQIYMSIYIMHMYFFYYFLSLEAVYFSKPRGGCFLRGCSMYFLSVMAVYVVCCMFCVYCLVC